LRFTAEYMAMDWRGALIGSANKPGDVREDKRAMLAAETFFAK
jgi:hypothetical protein